MKIGVFDSGVGGLTVLTELLKARPGDEFVYLGDTANVPYGPKSAAQVARLSVDCARTLRDDGVDAIVVACNTASSVALDAMRAEVAPIPVIGVVEPGVEATLAAAQTLAADARVLVLATRATVRSGAYGRALRAKLKQPVFELACPLLVPLIEEGWLDHPVLHQTLQEYLAEHSGLTGVALLGCTHYPWIQRAFEQALPGWRVLNSAQAVVEALGRKLPPAPGTGGIRWKFTDPAAVPEFARELMKKLGESPARRKP